MLTQSVTKIDLSALGDGLRETIRENTREIISHFNQGQAAQNEQIRALGENVGVLREDVGALKEDVGKIKLAIVDLMPTDCHPHNLVQELRAVDIPLNEAKIFTAQGRK